MTDTERVQEAIKRLKEKMPSYYEKCLKQRLNDGGEGSYYVSDIDFMTLESMLECSVWEKVEHPSVKEPCTCFLTHNMCGHIGIVNIEELTDDLKFFLDDFKNTGKLSLCVKQDDNWRVPMDSTYLILGNDGFGEIMFTFHPGEPIEPSSLEDNNNEWGIKKGDVLTKEQALKYGFRHAKVVR